MKKFICLLTILFSQFAFAEWKYSEKTDSFEGTSSKRAMTISINSVDLPFPYNSRPISAMFAIAKSSKGSQGVFLAVDNGQVVCDYQNCKVKIKFDDKEPMSFDANRSDTSKAFTITGEEALKIIEIAKLSKKAVVRFTFFKTGYKDFEFNTEGLVWE